MPLLAAQAELHAGTFTLREFRAQADQQALDAPKSNRSKGGLGKDGAQRLDVFGFHGTNAISFRYHLQADCASALDMHRSTGGASRCGSAADGHASVLAGTADRCSRLMDRREAPGQKADGNPQRDGAARSVRAIGRANRCAAVFPRILVQPDVRPHKSSGSFRCV